MWWMKSARDTLTSHPQLLGRKLDKAFPGKNAADKDVESNVYQKHLIFTNIFFFYAESNPL